MSAPTAERTSWPGLGFDPAPGEPAQVQHLTQQLDQVARLLGTTHTRLADVASGRGSWQGAGATAFTAKVGPLPRYLDEAATSLGRARQVLTSWHDVLADLKKQATALETKAAAAQQRVTQAEHAANQASSDPLMGYVGTNQMLPPDLYAKVDAALKRSEAATATLRTAAESLEELRRQGRVLLDRHDDGAHQAADGVRRADDGLAPPEPGYFENAMGWIEDHLADIADVTGAIAAIAGVVALFPPAAPIAAPVAIAAAAVTAGFDIADTAVHDQWKNPDNLKKLGLDAVGLVPGARFVGGIGRALAKGERAGSLAERAVRAVVPPSWGPGRKRVAAGTGINKAGGRIVDIGQDRERIDDWGVGRFKETVDERAEQAHGVIDQAGRVAGGVERVLTGDDSAVRGLEEKAHGAVDTAAGAAKDVATDAGKLADRAVDGLDRAVEGSGVAQPVIVTPETVPGTPVPADAAPAPEPGASTGPADAPSCAPPPPPDCSPAPEPETVPAAGPDPVPAPGAEERPTGASAPPGPAEVVGGALEDLGGTIEDAAPDDPEPDGDHDRGPDRHDDRPHRRRHH